MTQFVLKLLTQLLC